jgi:hypothetical protein
MENKTDKERLKYCEKNESQRHFFSTVYLTWTVPESNPDLSSEKLLLEIYEGLQLNRKGCSLQIHNLLHAEHFLCPKYCANTLTFFIRISASEATLKILFYFYFSQLQF